MNTSHPVVRIVRWAALISGTLLLGFLLYMLVGHLMDVGGHGDDLHFRTHQEVLQFFLFPVCTIVGLALAYRWELLGGSIVVISTAVLCILRHDLLHGAFLVWSSPALIYLLHWWLAQGHRRVARTSAPS